MPTRRLSQESNDSPDILNKALVVKDLDFEKEHSVEKDEDEEDYMEEEDDYLEEEDEDDIELYVQEELKEKFEPL